MISPHVPPVARSRMLASLLVLSFVGACQDTDVPTPVDASATAGLDAGPDVLPPTGADAQPDDAASPRHAAGPDTGAAAVPDTRLGMISDAGPDIAAPANPAACPATTPIGSCAVAGGVQCRYEADACPGAAALSRLCACEGGVWSCIKDIGCPSKVLQSTPPASCTGACNAGDTCRYVVERCAAAPDLEGHCSCSNGTWSCRRDYHCYPPAICGSADGRSCVTVGFHPTGNFCPAGTTLGCPRALSCTPAQPRVACTKAGAASREAVCVYERWACPVGYQFGS